MFHFKDGLFFGFEVQTPFVETLLKDQMGKMQISPLPFLFFQESVCQKVDDLVCKMPEPSFRVGPIALAEAAPSISNHILGNVQLCMKRFGADLIGPYQKLLRHYFIQEGCQMNKKNYTKQIFWKGPSLFSQKIEDIFHPFPFYFLNFHLYKRCEKRRYVRIWTHDFLPPFKEVESGNFILYGESFQQIFLNAQIALSFKFPAFTAFIDDKYRVRNLHDGGVRLMTLIYKVCDAIKIPIRKAIFPDHGKQEKGLLKWDLRLSYYD